MKISVISDDLIRDDKSGHLSHVSQVVEISSLDELAAMACEFHITPAVFSDNVRRKDHLISIDFICYDFDSGITVNEVTHKLDCENYSYVVIASKNHMKHKEGTGIRPRFHVFLPVSDSIRTPGFYKSVVKNLADLLKLDNYDKACTDCTRYFYKHSEVLKISCSGNLVRTNGYYFTSLYNRETQNENAFHKEMLGIVGEQMDKFKRAKCYQEAKSTLSLDGSRQAKLFGLVYYGKVHCNLSENTLTELLLPFCRWGDSFTRAYFDKTVKRSTWN